MRRVTLMIAVVALIASGIPADARVRISCGGIAPVTPTCSETFTFPASINRTLGVGAGNWFVFFDLNGVSPETAAGVIRIPIG